MIEGKTLENSDEPKDIVVKKETTPVKNVGGRPTKYREEYCDMLVDHMAKGNSITSFAGMLKVDYGTLQDWTNKYPSFSQAKKVGQSISQHYWEDMGNQMAKDGNSAVWIFNMKNRFGWKDRTETEITSNEDSPLNITFKVNGKDS